jgi:hypothetical protein
MSSDYDVIGGGSPGNLRVACKAGADGLWFG